MSHKYGILFGAKKNLIKENFLFPNVNAVFRRYFRQGDTKNLFLRKNINDLIINH